MAAIVKSLSAQQVIAVELNRKAIDKKLTRSTGTVHTSTKARLLWLSLVGR